MHQIQTFLSFTAKRDKPCPYNCHPAHMCKGDITRKLTEKYNPTKIFFAGDGRNDFCGMCAVEHDCCKKIENDEFRLKLARKGFSLEKFLKKSGCEDSFPSFWWSDGFDLIEFLRREPRNFVD